MPTAWPNGKSFYADIQNGEMDLSFPIRLESTRFDQVQTGKIDDR